jgi:hypothetical protein
MRYSIFGSLALCSLAVAACASGDEAQVDDTTAELAATDSNGKDEDAYVREAFMSDQGKVVEEIQGTGPITAATVSFWQTCRPYKYYAVQNSTGRIVEAYSDSCRRRNGTWGGATFWSGSCAGDVANCNGALRCGGC